MAPAQCYDPNATNFPAFMTVEQTVPTPNTYSNYAAGVSGALHTVGYFFGCLTNNSSIDDDSRLLASPKWPVPGMPEFSPANQTPLLICPIGRHAAFPAWAKLSIVNGYTNKFAYLGQYFDDAYTTDANGAATTNSAGILSEYGEFFPLQAGRAALVTKPDIDTGDRGTGYVHVVKLQLDVNHDGVMVTSFTGPDNTSQGKPFVFWVNNDRDYSADVTRDPGKGYHGAYTNLSGRIVNFYNPLDKVLGFWITNHKLLKPSAYFDTSFYYFDGTNSYFHPVFGGTYMVTDSQESRAMVSRSRTDPIGQSGPAAGHGVIQSAVNLNAQYGFNGSSGDEHIAQWTRPIQTSLPYYLQILESIKP